MSLELEKNPVPASTIRPPGQFPFTSLMICSPAEIGRPPEVAQNPEMVVGANISWAMLEVMLVSIEECESQGEPSTSSHHRMQQLKQRRLRMFPSHVMRRTVCGWSLVTLLVISVPTLRSLLPPKFGNTN